MLPVMNVYRLSVVASVYRDFSLLDLTYSAQPIFNRGCICVFSFQVNISKHVSVWNRPTMDIGDLCLQSLSIDEYLPDEIKRYKHVMEIRNWSKKLQYSKDLEGHPFHIESSFFEG